MRHFSQVVWWAIAAIIVGALIGFVATWLLPGSETFIFHSSNQ